VTADSSSAKSDLQRGLQFAILIQLNQHGRIDLVGLEVTFPTSDRRDLLAALEYLLEEGSIEGWTQRLEPLTDLAAEGFLRLTDTGRQRLAEDDI
jgi:hypothetical protein